VPRSAVLGHAETLLAAMRHLITNESRGSFLAPRSRHRGRFAESTIRERVALIVKGREARTVGARAKCCSAARKGTQNITEPDSRSGCQLHGTPSGLARRSEARGSIGGTCLRRELMLRCSSDPLADSSATRHVRGWPRISATSPPTSSRPVRRARLRTRRDMRLSWGRLA
jgi:hypothetical protein